MVGKSSSIFLFNNARRKRTYVDRNIFFILHKNYQECYHIVSLHYTNSFKIYMSQYVVFSMTFFYGTVIPLFSGSFIVAWLPYSIYGFICILGYSKDIPLVWHTIPSVFAKASILWNPLIYASRSKVMKKALAETFPFLRWLIRNPDKVQTNEQKNQTSLTLLRSRTLNSSDVVVQSSSENPAISASV